MRAALDWNVDGADWPLRTASRFVEAQNLRWHVQILGEGPPVLLLHGTGAATHSWRGLAPHLARAHTLIAPDLPGHGFTSEPSDARQFSLPAVADAVRALLRTLEVAPRAVIGHSAGAAVAARLALDDPSIRHILALNGAFKPFPGLLGPWARLSARMLLLNPFALSAFAARAGQPGAVARLLAGTGSQIEPEGEALYARLFQTRRHLASTIQLMAHWDLDALAADVPRLSAQVTQLVGARDRAVPPDAAAWLEARAPRVRTQLLPDLGHLAHEEAPAEVAARCLAALAEA